MRRNGPWAFVFLLVLAVVLTYWLGPRPVYELWEARKLTEAPPGTLSEQPSGPRWLGKLALANGIAAHDLPDLRLGDRLCDVDSDGDLDLLRVETASAGPAGPRAEAELRLRLHLNVEGRFRDVTSLMGPAFEASRTVLRTPGGPDLEVADLDRDRKLDVILRSGDGSAWALYNRLSDRHAVLIRLHPAAPPGGGPRVDETESAEPGRVELAAGGRVQVRFFRGRAPAATGPILVHFGLGANASLDRLRVEWPSGVVVERAGLDADQTIDVDEREEAHQDTEEPSWKP